MRPQPSHIRNDKTDHRLFPHSNLEASRSRLDIYKFTSAPTSSHVSSFPSFDAVDRIESAGTCPYAFSAHYYNSLDTLCNPNRRLRSMENDCQCPTKAGQFFDSQQHRAYSNTMKCYSRRAFFVHKHRSSSPRSYIHLHPRVSPSTPRLPYIPEQRVYNSSLRIDVPQYRHHFSPYYMCLSNEKCKQPCVITGAEFFD